MKSTLVKTLVAVPLLALSSLTFAAGPVQLNVAEMDGVTAGAIAGGTSIATAVGSNSPLLVSYAATLTTASGSAWVLASYVSGLTTIHAVGTLSTATSASASL